MTLAFDLSLLPDESDSERCAAHAERIDLDPGGSALWVDELIVVDVPLPWPKPVWAKDGFTAVPELMMAAAESGRRVRVLAAVPLDDGISRVVTHRLENHATFARAEHHVAAAEVAGLLSSLLADGLDASQSTVVSTAPVREFLLCTQGSHDMCCGSRGRMAPTGVTLPDGRMWGMVTTTEMAAILHLDASPAAVATRCRGWIGAAGGPEQMAERAVFAELDDWSFGLVPRTTRVISGDGSTVVEVDADGDRWRVEVAPGRAVPTIACGEPGGLPAKPGAEWAVVSVSRTS